MNTIATVEPVVAESAVSDEEPFFEVIDGQRVEMPPVSAYASRITFRLAYHVNVLAQQQGTGEAVTETLFHLPLPVDRNRRPDMAYVSYQRWPRGQPQPLGANAWDVVPELAAEVISPHDLIEDLEDRLEEYFRSGVELVWVVFPKQRKVHVYETPNRIRVVLRSEVLDGGLVLPSFQLSLTELFVEENVAS